MSVLLGLLLPILVSAALSTILVIAVHNAWVFPRLRRTDTAASITGSPASGPASGTAEPRVAVLIPARNEAAVIAETVRALVAQEYPRFRVLVLDDQSEDGTAQAATSAAACSPSGAASDAVSVRVLRGQPLPPGWMGKNWACHQLADAVAADDLADVLVFTDADVRWQPGALQALIEQMQRSDADLLTVWPTQITVTWVERLVVPLMALAVLGYLPLRLAQEFYHPLAAAANGQCMAFRRSAYAAIGGHAAVRKEVVEDVRLAQRIKAAGLHLRMADGNRLIVCRMYDGAQATIDGFAKNILAGHAHSVAVLAASTVFHWMVFVWPWLWLLLGSGWPLVGWWLWPLALMAVGVAVRAVTAGATHQRVGDALLMPVSVVLMTYIAARAVWWRYRVGGVKWKGRIVRNA